MSEGVWKLRQPAFTMVKITKQMSNTDFHAQIPHPEPKLQQQRLSIHCHIDMPGMQWGGMSVGGSQWDGVNFCLVFVLVCAYEG